MKNGRMPIGMKAIWFVSAWNSAFVRAGRR